MSLDLLYLHAVLYFYVQGPVINILTVLTFTTEEKNKMQIVFTFKFFYPWLGNIDVEGAWCYFSKAPS